MAISDLTSLGSKPSVICDDKVLLKTIEITIINPVNLFIMPVVIFAKY